MGIITPIRAEYHKISAMLSQHADILSELLTQIYFTYRLDIKEPTAARLTDKELSKDEHE